ncbi:hypothetical protein QAD02_021926 [Eretmocerus hayati]|uniref:Uncharacterized protein n=1 Tax=Eretmocerus hayati TaxID=131215 RepID=A0ACC2PRV9_9HYME|nr:hypothetical protein QAD02_021926 [Eretmocerus hayati]
MPEDDLPPEEGHLLQWKKNGGPIPVSTKRYRKLAAERKAREEAEQLQRLQDYIEQTVRQDSSDDCSSDESSEEDGYATASSPEPTYATASAPEPTRSIVDDSIGIDVAAPQNGDISSEDEHSQQPATVGNRFGSDIMDSNEESSTECSDSSPDSSSESSESSSDEGSSNEEDENPHVQANLDEFHATMDGDDARARELARDDVVTDPKTYMRFNLEIMTFASWFNLIPSSIILTNDELESN